MAAPGGTAVEVYDQRVHDLAISMGAYRDVVSRGVALTAPTARALAALFELPAETFLATLEAANRAAKGETADPLDRKAFARPLSPPFWGVRITGALAHTQGGLLVNSQAQVIRSDGSPIAGLLAAGGTVTGISGHGAGGYSSGNGLAQAFALGMIAAETIADKHGSENELHSAYRHCARRRPHAACKRIGAEFSQSTGPLRPALCGGRNRRHHRSPARSEAVGASGGNSSWSTTGPAPAA